jgi:hypothetical protein
MLIRQNAMNSLYEGLACFLFPEALQKFVAADRVGFIDVGVYCVNHFGDGPVENPVVQWKNSVSRGTGNNGYPFNHSGLFKAIFCSTINGCLEVID